MATAPTDGTRVLLRCLDRVVRIGRWCSQEVFGLSCNDWHSDSGTFLEADGWLPLPDVDECQPIEVQRPPISLFDFVVRELRSASEDAPIPWDLLKDSPLIVEDATELAFLLDVDVSFIQGIDRKHRSWVAENG